MGLWEAIKELVILVGLIYCVGAGLMGVAIYLLIIVRITDVYLHPDEYPIEYEEDDEH